MSGRFRGSSLVTARNANLGSEAPGRPNLPDPVRRPPFLAAQARGMTSEMAPGNDDDSFAALFERSGRMFAPSAGAWHRSGDLLSDMARKEGLEIGRLSKSFANDLLLALSCREEGCVLVTASERDFQRIRRYVPFDYIAPWPGGLLP